MYTRPPIRAIIAASLCLSAALIVISPASAAEKKGEWLRTEKSCEFSSWNAMPVPDEKIEWTGACKDDVAHGTGKLQWYRDGNPTSYEQGQCANGKWHGRVVSYINDHVRYEGNFAYGRRIGLTRQIYDKVILEGLKTQSPYKEWIAQGYGEKDEFVLPMLYSRFQDRRICPKAEQDKDQCQSQASAFIAAEEAAMTTINQLGRCLNQAEALAQVYADFKPDKKMLNYYGNAYNKISAVAVKRGFGEHMEAAQVDTQPAMFDDVQRALGPRLDALRQQDEDDGAARRAQAKASIEALVPYFKKNCSVFAK